MAAKFSFHARTPWLTLVSHRARSDCLAFRSRLSAEAHGGASLTKLADMLRRNTKLALDLDLPERLWSERAAALESKVRRIATDNRLHA
jgi:hypothetical protein